MKGRFFLVFVCFTISLGASAARGEPLQSDVWGFTLDPPAGYSLADGDGKNSFSFQGPGGAMLDLKVYPASSLTPETLATDTQGRLKSAGETSPFEYHHKAAALMELLFSLGTGRSQQRMSGWGLCVALPGQEGEKKSEKTKNLLIALAYGPAENAALQRLHLSALDSLAPGPEDRLAPGPLTEFSYPRESRRMVKLAGLDKEAWFCDEDAEAAQALVDREFQVLESSVSGPLWQEAWARFYRAVYRDAFERLEHTAFVIERELNTGGSRDFAEAALKWVQGFNYERNLEGSDFVNLVSAAQEGRGDCDSRALLWALVLNQAAVPAAVMVSREFSHAMGLTDLPGDGARFSLESRRWLVAETTAKVALGLIGENVSDPSKWLGITLK